MTPEPRVSSRFPSGTGRARGAEADAPASISSLGARIIFDAEIRTTAGRQRLTTGANPRSKETRGPDVAVAIAGYAKTQTSNPAEARNLPGVLRMGGRFPVKRCILCEVQLPVLSVKLLCFESSADFWQAACTAHCLELDSAGANHYAKHASRRTRSDRSQTAVWFSRPLIAWPGNDKLSE